MITQAVYVGHEYTVANLRYAQHAEPDNQEIARKMEWAKVGKG
jgi:hydroxyacylglutathione hydrolase